MLVDTIHQAMALLDRTPSGGAGHQLRLLLEMGQPTPTPGGGGAPDFSNIQPDSRGVPKSGVITTLAQIILWVGLSISFLMFIGSIIGWVAGHQAGGMHVSQNAKVNMLRALFGGRCLTAAGAIWTWFTTNV